MYVIMGADKCVLIDTGCDSGDYRAFVEQHINKQRKPFHVINTHVHFDHVGGNHRFTEDSKIIMSDRKKEFTLNFPLTSLCVSHGTQVKPFVVTDWVSHGAVISLDDSKPLEGPDGTSLAKSLVILHTPGHTLDSLSVYYPAESRLFIGDLLYPYTAIPISAVGSSVVDYRQSLDLLKEFVIEHEVTTLSCGHVEAGLKPDAISEVQRLMDAIQAGSAQPSAYEDDGVAQYSSTSFNVLIPLDAKWA